MKKLLLILTASLFTFFSFSQDASKKGKKDWSKVKLTGRANDHFMAQFGYAAWASKPDSINTHGFSRSFNFYVMLDMPFKTDPRFSVAFGPGVGTDNIYFQNTHINVANHLDKHLRFQNVADTNHFEKYKLVSGYLELPLELRFCMNPENSNKSFKVALGAKIGMLTDIHTKGKKWENRYGTAVVGYSENYVQKEKDKYFFSGNRICGTFRVGYGNFTAYTTYQLGAFVKEGLGPILKPWSIGLCISGL
jgi:hypothetical protein